MTIDTSVQHLMVLRSGPGATEATSALMLAAELQTQGRPVTLVLVQDAVLAGLAASQLASAQQVRALLADGAACYVLTDDLAMRGFRPSDLVASCTTIDDAELVDLLLADGARVSGAF
ncbi:MAG: DsrE family protein [Chloroflexi bacterium]|nr:DsrE family protein [Chloroflexota bacterium]